MATATPSKTKSKKITTKVRPLGDKVLIQRDVSAEMTDSGIYLPEQAKDKPKSGVIVAVGEGALSTETGERSPMTVKKGDRVLFTSYAGTEVKLGDDELLIMSEDEILAIVD